MIAQTGPGGKNRPAFGCAGVYGSGILAGVTPSTKLEAHEYTTDGSATASSPVRPLL